MGYRPNGVAPRRATQPPAPPPRTLRPCGCKETPEPVIVWLIETTVGWLCPTCLADVPERMPVPAPRQVTRTPPGEPHPDTHEWERPPVGVITIDGMPQYPDTITATRQRYAADGVSPPTGEPTDVYGRRMDAADVLDEVKAKVNHVRTGRGVGPQPRDEIRTALVAAQNRATFIADGFGTDDKGFTLTKDQYAAYVTTCNEVRDLQNLLARTPEYVVS